MSFLEKIGFRSNESFEISPAIEAQLHTVYERWVDEITGKPVEKPNPQYRKYMVVRDDPMNPNNMAWLERTKELAIFLFTDLTSDMEQLSEGAITLHDVSEAHGGVLQEAFKTRKWLLKNPDGAREALKEAPDYNKYLALGTMADLLVQTMGTRNAKYLSSTLIDRRSK